jgi:DNA-binding XRE family transcriptional regulator
MPKRLRQANRQHQIYSLIDPRDNTTRYVGRSDDVQYRLYQHLQGIGDSRQTKRWIRELLQQGLAPRLEILETIEVADNQQARVCEREEYWIGVKLRQGCNLLNSFAVTRAYPQPRLRVAQTDIPRSTRSMSRVRELRIKAALNVSRLAQLADVSRPTIEKMENDDPVRPDLASAVCRVLSKRLGYEVTIESAKIKVLS